MNKNAQKTEQRRKRDASGEQTIDGATVIIILLLAFAAIQ